VDYEILRSQPANPAENTSTAETPPSCATTCRIFKAINGTILAADCQQHRSSNSTAATLQQQHRCSNGKKSAAATRWQGST